MGEQHANGWRVSRHRLVADATDGVIANPMSGRRSGTKLSRPGPNPGRAAPLHEHLAYAAMKTWGVTRMTGVSVSTAMPGARFWIRVAQRAAALLVVAAGIFALWYRQTYNVWPGPEASTRIHWCGRDYESFGGTPQTQQQISSQNHFLIRPVGQYPPLAWSPQELFAAVVGAAPTSVSPPPLCATAVYLRTGPDQYQAYTLEGGP